MAVLGSLAGASYRRVEKIAGGAGLVLLALLVVGVVASRLLRRYADRPRLRAAGARLAATAPLVWIRRRYPRQVAWSRRRLDASDPRGFWLTFTVAAGALAGWAFGAITQDVLAREEIVLQDPHVTAWIAAHRSGWLTATVKVTGWPGSAIVIVVLVVLAVAFLAARRHCRPAIMLALALAGSVILTITVQHLVGRSRPPAALSIGHHGGSAFPTVQAATAIACSGMLARILGPDRAPTIPALLLAGPAAVPGLGGALPASPPAQLLT